MNINFYLKNYFYSLFFFSLTFIISGWNLELTKFEIFIFAFVTIFSSLMYPFAYFFILDKINFLTKPFNFVNWGAGICLLLSLPPVGLIFIIYYLLKNRRN
ncbi:hypothetical protein HW94_22950 [Salmonella enterica]|nr:hypothetical protein [Salmonella enterica]